MAVKLSEYRKTSMKHWCSLPGIGVPLDSGSYPKSRNPVDEDMESHLCTANWMGQAPDLTVLSQLRDNCSLRIRAGRSAVTLIASTRVPDGIIIAADSVSSIMAMGRALSAKGTTKCPHCGQEHEFSAPIQLPMGPGVTSTLPYSQKLQSLWARYGVGTHGSGVLGNRSVFAIIQEFEHLCQDTDDVEGVADALASHLQSELAKMPDIDKIPDDAYALGFQIVGYKEGNPLTFSVHVGKKRQIKDWGGFGTTVSGNTFVAKKLWELKGLGPQMEQPYPAWSIQDAADYCEFLIETTAKYQRFANVIPTVGGDIDIGLVLPGNRFKWIKRKKLSTILSQEDEHEPDQSRS